MVDFLEARAMALSRFRKPGYLLPLAVAASLVLAGTLTPKASPPMASVDDADDNDVEGYSNLPKAVDVDPDPDVFETFLVAMEAPADLGNGVTTTASTFNGIVPGPLFKLKIGEKVIVHFTNNLPIPATIHWHGVELTNRSDGTGVTQDAVPPGGTFTYDFMVPRPGIFSYHSHIMPTNPEFKGYYGLLIVEDPAEPVLIEKKVIPKRVNTKVLVLADTTVCKEPGWNDTTTYPADPTLPWAGGSEFPGKLAQPSPEKLCEEPLDEHGHFLLPHPGTALPAGTIPNIQPSPDCNSPGQPGCPTNEGQLVLTNGKVAAARAGSPSAPGALSAGPAIFDVKPGEGIRLQLGNAATIRYFRLRLTDQRGSQVALFRIGGQGGLLDNVRLEGGIQGTLNTQYDYGEILLPVAAREDVVFAVPTAAAKGDVLTLWTLDYQRTGNGFALLPTVPVAHFRVKNDNKGKKFTIAAGDPLLVHPNVNTPTESLKFATPDALLNSSLFVPPQPGSVDGTIRLTAFPGGKPGINGTTNPIFDAGAMPPAPFTSIPHVAESRWAAVGDLLELTVSNATAAHHPWHPHGFSIQPVRITDAVGTTLFEYPYNEFVDVVDIPPGSKLVYRVRLDDRPFSFTSPTGGAVGRWVMHCHIFFHAALGMITELVAVP
jgi:FtsP/CotA-like multicopper oxidase with cupredoxin domain